MGVEGVLPGERLVVVVAPVAPAAGDGVLGDEAVGVARAEEACEAEALEIGVPVVAPVVGALEVLFELGVASLSKCDGGDGEVVDRAEDV